MTPSNAVRFCVCDGSISVDADSVSTNAETVACAVVVVSQARRSRFSVKNVDCTLAETVTVTFVNVPIAGSNCGTELVSDQSVSVGKMVAVCVMLAAATRTASARINRMYFIQS